MSHGPLGLSSTVELLNVRVHSQAVSQVSLWLIGDPSLL